MCYFIDSLRVYGETFWRSFPRDELNFVFDHFPCTQQANESHLGPRRLDAVRVRIPRVPHFHSVVMENVRDLGANKCDVTITSSTPYHSAQRISNSQRTFGGQSSFSPILHLRERKGAPQTALNDINQPEYRCHR